MHIKLLAYDLELLENSIKMSLHSFTRVYIYTTAGSYNVKLIYTPNRAYRRAERTCCLRRCNSVRVPVPSTRFVSSMFGKVFAKGLTLADFSTTSSLQGPRPHPPPMMRVILKERLSPSLPTRERACRSRHVDEVPSLLLSARV